MSKQRTGAHRSSRLTHPWPVTVATQARLSGTRLREAWASLLGRFPWQWFVTLTFDPKRFSPVSCAVVEREATEWCNQVARMRRLPVGWVCAPERGRGGGWHAHVLLVAKRGIWSPQAALPVWQERNGRIDARPVTDHSGIALYTTKTAAEAGTLVLSDTLTRYQPRAGSKVVVPLWPGVCSEGPEGVSR